MIQQSRRMHRRRSRGSRTPGAAALSKILEVIGETGGMADIKTAVEKDLAEVKKPAAKQKAKAIQIESKAAYIEREEKRLTELQQDIVKATAALAQRRAALEKERGALAQLRLELLKDTGGTDMEVDGALADLERQELDLLRKLSANFQKDGKVASPADAKRLAGDLEKVQKDIESKRRRTAEAAEQAI